MAPPEPFFRIFPQTADLLLEIDEDTFKPFLQRFAASVWQVRVGRALW